MLSEMIRLPAVEQARLIRRREVSSEELTALYLGRIEAQNPSLGAFVEVMREQAMREARQRDRVRRGAEGAPFWGVPIAIKDMNFVRGAGCRMGSRAWRHFHSPFDDETAAKLRLAGFVCVGKTATSELGILPTSEPDFLPPARNPWAPELSPGGSSGGSAAAVAAGLVPIAQGSDGAGSVRIPSAHCGLFGIKPSRGRVANPYGVPDDEIIYTCGPIARSVDDAAALLDVLAGITVGAPHWAPPPRRPFAELCKRELPRLRVRFTSKSNLAPTDPEIAAAVEQAARLLSSLGHDVDEGEQLEGDVAEFQPIMERLAALAPVADWSLVEPLTRWLAERGRGRSDDEVLRLRRALEARVLAWFGGADVWLLPTVPLGPPRVGAWRELGPAEVFASAVPYGPFTAAFNASGQPASSVPYRLSSEGLPIGVQVVGKPFADALVLSVSRLLEREGASPQARAPRPSWLSADA